MNSCEMGEVIMKLEFLTDENDLLTPKLVEQVSKDYSLTPKTTFDILMGLRRHPDIFAEFVKGLAGEDFKFPNKKDSIKVCGYTAHELHKKHPLSPLTAYSYLVCLREEPRKTLADLKAGLT